MRLRAPIVVRPAMTTCGPTRVPAPIRTSLPMIEYAPTSTSAAISALGSICAVEWSRDIGLGNRRVANGRDQLGLACELAVDARARAKLADPSNDADHFRFENQLIAGNDLALEAGAVNAGKIDQRSAAGLRVAGIERKERRQLGERLDDQHPRHQRIGREMSLEERLVERHVLQAADRYAGLTVEHAVDQQERIAMRKLLEDFPYVERLH